MRTQMKRAINGSKSNGTGQQKGNNNDSKLKELNPCTCKIHDGQHV